MIPQNKDRVEFLQESELKVGMVLKVLTEMKADDRFKSPMTGEVMIPNGEKRLLGMNWTTYYTISKDQAFGRDTADWVGKNIVYMGKQKTKKGAMAKVFGPTEQTIQLTSTKRSETLNDHLKKGTPKEFLLEEEAPF